MYITCSGDVTFTSSLDPDLGADGLAACDLTCLCGILLRLVSDTDRMSLLKL